MKLPRSELILLDTIYIILDKPIVEVFEMTAQRINTCYISFENSVLIFETNKKLYAFAFPEENMRLFKSVKAKLKNTAKINIVDEKSKFLYSIPIVTDEDK